MDERVWHFVKPNERTRVPRRHIFLDTETVKHKTKTGHVQRWRLGVAAFHRAEKGRQAHGDMSTFKTPAQLWEAVSAWTKPRHRTILWAHNLGFDVRIAEAFTELPRMGWRIEAHNLANRGTWVQWRRNGASLLMVDSSSVFPVALEQLGKAFGLGKLNLPDDGDSFEAWEARCKQDVVILRHAMLEYLAWLEREELGSWQMTGAGQSYAAFRHKHLTHNMLVHADADALAAERKAMWTGRCEAYRKGRIGSGGVEEWDLSLAYARIARRERVPTRLIGPTGADIDLRGMLARRSVALLAEVEVETSVPVLPTTVDGRMAWPIGKFTTTVWGPELALALRVGATIRVVRGWIYQTAPALEQWASWIIDGLTPGPTERPAWQKIVFKHWSRALIGRFGMSYTEWERFGATLDSSVRQINCYDTRTGQDFTVTHLGTDVHASKGVVEWGQSQPAITGYVMSACRVWLWDVCEAMGPEAVLYVDTDSFYTTPEHHAQAVALSQTPLGEGLRCKATYDRALIMGPRQIVTGGKPRIAGLPAGAVRMPDGRYEGEVWTSLAASIKRGTPSTVATSDRTWRIKGVDNRRVDGPDGWTLPITIGLGA